MKARLVAVLAEVCPRVYPHGTAPSGVVRPYVTYYGFGAKTINYVDDAIPDSQNAAMQISVWADRQTEADLLIKQIENAIRTATTIQGRTLSGAIDAPYEPATKLCGSIQRFDIWAAR